MTVCFYDDWKRKEKNVLTIAARASCTSAAAEEHKASPMRQNCCSESLRAFDEGYVYTYIFQGFTTLSKKNLKLPITCVIVFRAITCSG